MDDARQQLGEVLREARVLLARPGNNFDWSGWEDEDEALAEIDGLLGTLDSGRLPYWPSVSILFAPTGPIQEVSLSSGWGDQFLALADRADAAVEQTYGRRG